jgi:hypothetical protein
MRIEGFVQVIVGAFFERNCSLGRCSNLCEKNGWYPDILTSKATQYFTPVHERHQYIQNDQLRLVRPGFF